MLADIRRMVVSPTGALAFTVGTGCGLYVVLARAMAYRTVTFFLEMLAWGVTSAVLGGDPGFTHPTIVVAVASIASGAIVVAMSVVAAIVRWSRSDECGLRLRWNDVAVAILLYAALSLFDAGGIV